MIDVLVFATIPGFAAVVIGYLLLMCGMAAEFTVHRGRHRPFECIFSTGPLVVVAIGFMVCAASIPFLLYRMAMEIR